jgi:hypothetical protein
LSHPIFCRYADLDSEGRRVVTMDAYGVVRLWDGRIGDPLGRLDHWPKAKKPRFSRDGRRLVVAADDKRLLDLPAYEGTVTDLPALLRLLTGLDRDEDGSVAQVDHYAFRNAPEAYTRVWQKWVNGTGERSPPRLVSDKSERLLYHGEHADLAEKEKRWFAASFHLKRLLLDRPDDAKLKQRLEQACARLKAETEEGGSR